MYSYLKYLLGYSDEYSKNDDETLETYQEIKSKKLEISTISDKIIFTQPRIVIHNPTNFYYLSLIKEENEWSVHGLWPQNSVQKYPQFCNKQASFNLSKLNSIIDKLNEVWYSNREKNEDFWKHEYLKHGTCNFNNLNELDYFKKTLELYYKSLEKDLPDKYYNDNTKKCLIPVTKEWIFFTISK